MADAQAIDIAAVLPSTDVDTQDGLDDIAAVLPSTEGGDQPNATPDEQTKDAEEWADVVANGLASATLDGAGMPFV